jgi:hypothetical protein
MKELFKKWWFWLIIILIVVVIIFFFVPLKGCGTQSYDDGSGAPIEYKTMRITYFKYFSYSGCVCRNTCRSNNPINSRRILE